MSAQSSRHKEFIRILRFGLVGVANTIVDFVVLNVLAITLLPKDLTLTTLSIGGLSFAFTGLIVAGLISGTAAMICSFVLNTRFTFQKHNVDLRHGIYFFLITIFGLYVIRPIILKFVTGFWVWPGQVAYYVTSTLRLPLSREFDERNVALMLAILVVLAYNYLMYKYFVFNTHEKN